MSGNWFDTGITAAPIEPAQVTSNHVVVDEHGDTWGVGYAGTEGGYFAYLWEGYDFELPDDHGIEMRTAFYDRDTQRFVCEWVDPYYDRDKEFSAPTLEGLRQQLGELPEAVYDKLTRDAAGAHPRWGNDGSLPTLADLERALAGHLTLPTHVRQSLAADQSTPAQQRWVQLAAELDPRLPRQADWAALRQTMQEAHDQGHDVQLAATRLLDGVPLGERPAQDLRYRLVAHLDLPIQPELPTPQDRGRPSAEHKAEREAALRTTQTPGSPARHR